MSEPGGPAREPTDQPTKPAEPYVAPQKKSALGVRGISALGYPDLGVFRMAEALFGWKKDEATKPSSKSVPLKCIRQASEIASVLFYCFLDTQTGIMGTYFIEGIRSHYDGILSFCGFSEEDRVQIQRHIRHHWKLELDVTKLSTRGWNWGQYDLVGDNMVLNINNDPAIYLNAKTIQQIAMNPGKSKHELYIGTDEEEHVPSNQDLVFEMKIHVVPDPEDEKEKKEGEAKQETHLEYLYNSLLAKSNLTIATASNVAFILEYMNLASPPGRFDIHVVSGGFKLYGKSGNFGPIPWTNVEAVYHIESKPSSLLLLALNTSLRKGQTSYKHIVVHLDDRRTREITLNLTDEGPTDKKLIEEYKLTPVIKAEERKLIPKLLAIYGSKRPIRAVMQDPNVENPKPMPSVECSYKQQLGRISFHAQCLIFCPKPPTIFKHEDIALVDFRSPSTRTKLFTFRLIMKASRGSSGGAVGAEHSMESLDRSEFDMIMKYFMDRNIKIRTGTLEEDDKEPEEGVNLNDDESSDDEDFQDDKDGSSDEGGLSDLESDDPPEEANKKEDN